MLNVKKFGVITLALLLLLTLVPMAPEVMAATSGDWQYYYDDWFDEVYITGYTGNAATVTIPPMLGGYPVTEIEDQAFWGCTTLVDVTLPDSIEYIGDYAFRNCTSLTNVTIPSGELGDRVFYDCKALTSVSLGRYVDFIEGYTFQNCESLTTINVDANNPDYMVADGVLFDKDKTMLVKYPAKKADTAYAIPESVTAIDTFAFQYCPALTSVFIPKNLTMLDLFRDCKSLTEISVDENNPSYVSIDGVVFTKDKTMIRQYPAGKMGTTYAIPESVTRLNTLTFGQNPFLISITLPGRITGMGSSVFAGCQSLINVTIESGVPMLGNTAFTGCPNLSFVTIPDSVTEIGNNVFSECPKLTLYCSEGSAAHTYAVQNGLQYSFNPLPTYTVTFDAAGGYTPAPVTGVAPGRQITEPAVPGKTGHTFAGWYKDAAGTQAWNFENDLVQGDTILYAKWNANIYKVIYKNNGAVLKEQPVEYGRTATAPSAPQKKNHVFAGWYKDTGFKTKWNFGKDIVKGDTTLYAKWTAIKGKITPATKKVKEGKTLKLTAKGNAAIKSVKWKTSSSRIASIKTSGKGKINCTVTGKKKGKKATVTATITFKDGTKKTIKRTISVK